MTERQRKLKARENRRASMAARYSATQEVLSDKGLMETISASMEDVAAGRVTPWAEVQSRIAPAGKKHARGKE